MEWYVNTGIFCGMCFGNGSFEWGYICVRMREMLFLDIWLVLNHRHRRTMKNFSKQMN